MYNFEFSGKSIIGRRPKNEDSFLIFRNKYNFLISAIADGMGGHTGGLTASKSIIKMVKKEFNNINFNSLDEEKIKRKLLTSIRIFQKELKRIGDEFPKLYDMGTTLNLNIFANNKMFSINVGDSRTQSFIKKDIIEITEDHNLATLAEKDEKYQHYKGQTNVLTSSLGPNKTTIADFFVTKFDSRKGYILMSSDGVHNFISKISLMKIIKSSSRTLDYKVKKIIKTAYENGSNDNMTFILVKYER